MKNFFPISLIVTLSFIMSFIIYYLTSAGTTPFDYFTRLADAFLHGRFWLTEAPPWLTELIPAGSNKYYVVYPPMPTILSIPFVAIFGKDFPQQYLAHLLGAGIVAFTILIAWTSKKDLKLALWSGILVGLGSIVWFLSSVGSSWYLGQITAAFFLTMAIYEGITKKRPFLIGIILGAAYLSRIHTIVSLPFFLFLLRKSLLKNIFLVGLGILPFFLFNAIYNFARYGVPWDQGYFLLPGILHEENAPWFIKGVANPLYLPDNLRVLFWSFPKVFSHFPYLQPSWAGLAIWITTPAFLFALKAPLKDHIVKFSWLAIILTFLIVGSHGGTGFAQFGYRFAVDFYPFLTFITMKGVAETGLRWYHWLLLFVGIIVNLWGVLWINKFGWVSY